VSASTRYYRLLIIPSEENREALLLCCSPLMLNHCSSDRLASLYWVLEADKIAAAAAEICVSIKPEVQ
jgi:hypothetical protein